MIVIECKNYQHELKKPEFDRIGGRLGTKIGRVGILAYRQTNDRRSLIKKCENYFDNEQKIIIPLNDLDFEQLLMLKMHNREDKIEYYLDEILLEIKAGSQP